ncbi:MAG TPA: response regulator transcription factor [Devosiaceae bacterium]|nr:response regulator transcription factor [Devosiaceae bacterium]
MFEVSAINTEQQIYAVQHSDPQNEVEAQGGILILADTGVAFQGLLQAAQRCFPKLDVTLSSQLPEDDGVSPAPRLILIYAFVFRNISGVAAQCRERYPATPIALMVDEAWTEVPGLRALVSERLVQGLLPLSMQINVWLATVWLLLNGGEYFPATAMARPGGAYLPGGGYGVGSASRLGEPGYSAEKGLSTREGQVLELMSEGLQNKLIAAKMDLSEHTVKVHVHNIIRKLKVHNRTQAAAVFRSFDRRPSYPSGGLTAS